MQVYLSDSGATFFVFITKRDRRLTGWEKDRLETEVREAGGQVFGLNKDDEPEFRRDGNLRE